MHACAAQLLPAHYCAHSYARTSINIIALLSMSRIQIHIFDCYHKAPLHFVISRYMYVQRCNFLLTTALLTAAHVQQSIWLHHGRVLVFFHFMRFFFIQLKRCPLKKKKPASNFHYQLLFYKVYDNVTQKIKKNKKIKK